MASPVSYQRFCPVGAALNVIGDRWALLIVRDLILGPRRYSELLSGLGGVGTDILAARLRGLQRTGVVQQRGTGRGRHYALTDSGLALRPVLIELARWGAERLELPGDPSQVPPRVPLTALLLGAPPLPRAADGCYEIRVASEIVRVEVTGGQVIAAPDSQPTAAITLTMTGLRGLITGATFRELHQSGDVTIDGNIHACEAFLARLSRPPALAGLRRRLESQTATRLFHN